MTDDLKIYNCNNIELMATMPDESIDVICIDPPYLYLKNQKLERGFDEPKFFAECARLLKKEGFIVMFGRGESFYRWNALLDCIRLFEGDYIYISKHITTSETGQVELKILHNGTDVTIDKRYKSTFTFKEEIVWDKMQISSPLNAIMRCHELVAIYSKGKGKINKIKVPITEAYKFEPKKIAESIYRITTTFGNRKTFDLVKKYFETGETTHDEGKERRFNASVSSDFPKRNRTVQFAVGLEEGITERTIIKQVREHYTSIHPTQKPVKLLERLLALVIPDKPRSEIVVADFFAGSMSCMEAVHNMGMQGIATEIDEEYFNASKERLENLQPKQIEIFG